MATDEQYKMWVAQIDARHSVIKREILSIEGGDPSSACIKAWARVVEEVRTRQQKIIEKYGDDD